MNINWILFSFSYMCNEYQLPCFEIYNRIKIQNVLFFIILLCALTVFNWIFIYIYFCFQATSSLDTETEQSIQDSLISLGIHRTVVIIAHRLTTVQNADLIIVLENGKVVEQGTHVELLSKTGGRYAELVMKMTQN